MMEERRIRIRRLFDNPQSHWLWRDRIEGRYIYGSQADVKFVKKELEGLKKEKIECHAVWKELRDRLGVPEYDISAPYFKAAIDERDSLREELAALRQPGVRVGVRWDVQTEVVAAMAFGNSEDDCSDSQYRIIKKAGEIFAAHAVIDVPPGVPSVPKLAKLSHDARLKSGHATKQYERLSKFYTDSLTVGATAIRDRVIAGMAAERNPALNPDIPKTEQGIYNKFNIFRTDGQSAPGCKHHDCSYFVIDRTHDKFAAPALRAYAIACADEYPVLSRELLDAYPPSVPTAPTPEQVEALARVLHKANTHGLPWTQARSGRMIEARAAFAHIGADVRTPMKLNIDPDWLLRMAEKEDGCCTSVAGSPLPTPAQVEALARDLHEKSNPRTSWVEMSEIARESYRVYARAAFAHIGAVAVPGVDMDAWKTPLVHGVADDPNKFQTTLKADGIMWGFGVIRDGRGESFWDKPEKAREWSIWLASYAAAHGCPMIASQSKEPSALTKHWIGKCRELEAVFIPLNEKLEADLKRATSALTRAGFQDLGGQEWKPPIGQPPHFIWNGPTRAEAEADWATSGKHPADWIYENLLPLLPTSSMPEPDGKRAAFATNSPIERIWNEAIAEQSAAPESAQENCEWSMYDEPGMEPSPYVPPFKKSGGTIATPEPETSVSTKPIDGLPTVDMMVKLLRSSNDSRTIQAQASTILAALRPWLKTPVGWTLDVTAGDVWIGDRPFHFTDADIDWLRSRITPCFDCPECAIAAQSISDLQVRLDHTYTNLAECEHRIDAARAALEGE